MKTILHYLDEISKYAQIVERISSTIHKELSSLFEAKKEKDNTIEIKPIDENE